VGFFFEFGANTVLQGLRCLLTRTWGLNSPIEFKWQIFPKYGKGLGHKDVLSLKKVHRHSVKGNRINWWNTTECFWQKVESLD